MNKELLEAITALGKEKNISKEALLEAIENSLMTACKNHFGTSDNCRVEIDPETCEYKVIQSKEVVEALEENTALERAQRISLADAHAIKSTYAVGDIINFPVESREFGRIATNAAKNVITQKIREEERRVIFNNYYAKEHEVVTGIVRRVSGKTVTFNIGKVDALLTESEQIKTESYNVGSRMKIYILEVKDAPKGPRVTVSRTHPDLVKKLFEQEVAEIKDGVVEIMCIAREPGSRSKMAVVSNDPNVDPIGACVGLNGSRVDAVVDELGGEKIDIVCYDDNPAFLIENALSPSKVIAVVVDEDSKEAQVIVPDYQLSLAIGKEGQNARLAARLTGYKIDIKSETQARELGLYDELGIDYQPEGQADFEAEYYDEGYDETAQGEDVPDGEYAGDGQYAAPEAGEQAGSADESAAADADGAEAGGTDAYVPSEPADDSSAAGADA